MMKEYDETLDALALNPAARVACVLCADCSTSMAGRPIDALNKGLARYFAAIRADDAAAMSVETALVAFSTEARVVHGFAPIDDYPPETPPPLKAAGTTATGAALRLAEKLLTERQALYRRAGIPSYEPWILLLTDGNPYPDKDWENIAARLKSRSAAGDLRYLAIGVGDKIEENKLAKLSPAEPGVIHLDGFKFEELFDWLATSLHEVSVGGVGAERGVPLRGIDTWARFAKKGGR